MCNTSPPSSAPDLPLSLAIVSTLLALWAEGQDNFLVNWPLLQSLMMRCFKETSDHKL
jgi:hypothetical protein